MKRTKHILGIGIAVILSLIAVVATASVAGIALRTSLQTKHFVEQWHKDSHDLWIQQAQIDAQLQTEIDVLKQIMGWLGKKYLSLQEQISLCWIGIQPLFALLIWLLGNASA